MQIKVIRQMTRTRGNYNVCRTRSAVQWSYIAREKYSRTEYKNILSCFEYCVSPQLEFRGPSFHDLAAR